MRSCAHGCLFGFNDVEVAGSACDDCVAEVAEEGELVEEAMDPESDSSSSCASASSGEIASAAWMRLRC